MKIKNLAIDLVVDSTPTLTSEIAERAHALWESEGFPPDAELRHWLQAERDVRRERGMSPAAPTEEGS